MPGRLTGKVAVITGGASGLGAATARHFVNEGAQVVLGDIQDELGTTVVEALGESARYVHCDVTIEGDIAYLIDAAMEAYGSVDVMMNSAGVVGARGPIASTSADEFASTLDIHVKGCFLGMKHAARVMQPRERGSIINLASVAGVQGGLGPHAYAAAKHSIVGLTKNVAAELCRYRIRVNCIAPGSIATPMVAKAHLGDHQALDAVVEKLAEKSPIKGRAGMPSDVSYAALYLASDEPGNTSGHCLVLDGGLTTGSSAREPHYSECQPYLAEGGRTGI
jgi:NAD(P)-dependent dehydrogenase (short-subunit alcohol dehydrogenase family)